MKQRNLFIVALLSVVTLGIYNIYWYCSFQNQLKEQTGEGFGGFGHLMMLLFTFGIYSIYWQYAAGKRLSRFGVEDRSVLYLVLGLIGFSIINKYIMQSQANETGGRPAQNLNNFNNQNGFNNGYNNPQNNFNNNINPNMNNTYQNGNMNLNTNNNYQNPNQNIYPNNTYPNNNYPNNQNNYPNNQNNYLNNQNNNFDGNNTDNNLR